MSAGSRSRWSRSPSRRRASILAFKNPHGWTGGEEGLGADYTKLPQGFVGIFNTKHLYWVALGFVTVAFVVVQWAVASSPGHIWQAIRENELRVEVLGLHPYAYKLMVFVLASFIATAGGVVYLLLLGGATPEVTSANFTLTLLVMVVIGGAGTRWGALLGGASTPGRTSVSATHRRRTDLVRAALGAAHHRCSSRCSCSACSSSSSSSSFPAGSSGSARCAGPATPAAPAGGDAEMRIAWEEQGRRALRCS